MISLTDGWGYTISRMASIVISCSIMMPQATIETPYEGAKEMLLVDNVENKAFLRQLLETMYEELPATKKRK